MAKIILTEKQFRDYCRKMLNEEQSKEYLDKLIKENLPNKDINENK